MPSFTILNPKPLENSLMFAPILTRRVIDRSPQGPETVLALLRAGGAAVVGYGVADAGLVAQMAANAPGEITARTTHAALCEEVSWQLRQIAPYSPDTRRLVVMDDTGEILAEAHPGSPEGPDTDGPQDRHHMSSVGNLLDLMMTARDAAILREAGRAYLSPVAGSRMSIARALRTAVRGMGLRVAAEASVPGHAVLLSVRASVATVTDLVSNLAERNQRINAGKVRADGRGDPSIHGLMARLEFAAPARHGDAEGTLVRIKEACAGASRREAASEPVPG